MDHQSRGRLDPLADARDFIYTPRPRVRPISPARKLQQIERQARSAAVSAAIAGSGGGGGSVPSFDAIPDATPEDVGQIIYLPGAAGEPAESLMAVQTPDDRILYEPVITQAYYGARTAFADEFYSLANWEIVGSDPLDPQMIDGGAGHPGMWELLTTTVSGVSSGIRLGPELAGVSPAGVMRLGDVERMAFIFQTPATTSNIILRVGIADHFTGILLDNGVYLEKEAETNWRFCKAVAGVETRVDSGISGLVTNNWFLLQIEYAQTAGAFLARLLDLTGSQGIAETTLTGLNESISLRPFFLVENSTAAIRRISVDYFWVLHRPTVRS